MFIAESFDDLHAGLLEINIDVPPRAEGRTKDHTERYAIVRLLATQPRCLEDFPLHLVKRERPDFLLKLGARRIGIEHTEAISENAAKEAFLRSQGHGPESYFLRPAAIDELRKSSTQLISEIEADLSGDGWGGDSVERSWASAMAHFVAQKLKTAGRSGFELFDENWLLIYDNWPAPARDFRRGLMLLHPQLNAVQPWRVFNRVLILDEKVLLEISADTTVFHTVHHDAR